MFPRVVACIKGHCVQFFGVDLSTDAISKQAEFKHPWQMKHAMPLLDIDDF